MNETHANSILRCVCVVPSLRPVGTSYRSTEFHSDSLCLKAVFLLVSYNFVNLQAQG